jgi:hypothetical protein
MSNEERFGVVMFDPKGGSEGTGSFDWAFCKNVPEAEAEKIAETWDRITGEDNHRVYALGVAPWRGYDVELDAQDVACALAWAEARRPDYVWADSIRRGLSASVALGAAATRQRNAAETLLRQALSALLLDDEEHALQRDEEVVRAIEAHFTARELGPHDRSDCPCGHPAGTQGPCAGCNCAG